MEWGCFRWDQGTGYLHPNTKQMPLNQATCSSWTRTSRASAPSCRRPPRRRRSLWPAWLPPKQHSLASAASLRRAVGIREAGTKLLGKTWWANFVWHVVLNVGYVGMLLKFQLARRLISSWEVWYAELAECEHVWRPHFVWPWGGSSSMASARAPWAIGVYHACGGAERVEVWGCGKGFINGWDEPQQPQKDRKVCCHYFGRNGLVYPPPEMVAASRTLGFHCQNWFWYRSLVSTTNVGEANVGIPISHLPRVKSR